MPASACVRPSGLRAPQARRRGEGGRRAHRFATSLSARRRRLFGQRPSPPHTVVLSLPTLSGLLMQPWTVVEIWTRCCRGHGSHLLVRCRGGLPVGRSLLRVTGTAADVLHATKLGSPAPIAPQALAFWTIFWDWPKILSCRPCSRRAAALAMPPLPAAPTWQAGAARTLPSPSSVKQTGAPRISLRARRTCSGATSAQTTCTLRGTRAAACPRASASAAGRDTRSLLSKPPSTAAAARSSGASSCGARSRLPAQPSTRLRRWRCRHCCHWWRRCPHTPSGAWCSGRRWLRTLRSCCLLPCRRLLAALPMQANFKFPP